MADNVLAAGAMVATDDVAGVQYQRVKLDVGGDGVSVPVVGAIPFDAGGTDVVDNSANANGLFTLYLPAVAGKRNYVTGFEISGSGATDVGSVYATLTGCGPFPMYYHLAVPTIASGGVVLLSVQFTRPIPASADDLAISLQVPAFGAGNALEAAMLHGFYR